MAAQVEPWEAASRAVREAVRAEIAADAAAGVRDADLDDVVTDFSDALLRSVGRNRDDRRYRQYFKTAPSRSVRTARRAEAGAVKSRGAQVRTERDPQAAAFAEPLERKELASLAALEGAAQAAGARAATRVRSWLEFVRALEAERENLHADLTLRGAGRQKPRGWADRFFRRASRDRASREPGAEAAPDPAAPAT